MVFVSSRPYLSVFLPLSCLDQLETGPHAPVYQLLNLFAYGTYSDYKGKHKNAKKKKVVSSAPSACGKLLAQVCPLLWIWNIYQSGQEKRTFFLVKDSVFIMFLCFCLSERAASLPELTPSQKNKLRHLSIISLASNLKVHCQFSFSFICIAMLTIHFVTKCCARLRWEIRRQASLFLFTFTFLWLFILFIYSSHTHTHTVSV